MISSHLGMVPADGWPKSRPNGALGDETRLRIVDALAWTDLTFGELAMGTGCTAILLAHHLAVLQRANLVRRRVSDADRRGRYVQLNHDAFRALRLRLGRPTFGPVHGRSDPAGGVVFDAHVAFVCTRNAARSQFASGLWALVTGSRAHSSGSDPVPQVDFHAVASGAEFGVDLSRSVPRGFEELASGLDIVVTLCDRARASSLPAAERYLHWSTPDPVRDDSPDTFATAFRLIEARVVDLARGLGDARRPHHPRRGHECRT